MNGSDQVRERIREIVGVKYETFPAEVVAVNTDSVNVLPIGDEAQIFDVRLKAALDEQDSGVMIVPKLGSTVLVTMIGGREEECFVSMVSDAEEIRVKIGQTSFFLDERGIVINEGKFGGLIKIEELRSELKKITDYLTAVKQVFSTWIPVPSDGGAALKTQMNGALASQEIPTFSQIENDKVKH